MTAEARHALALASYEWLVRCALRSAKAGQSAAVVDWACLAGRLTESYGGRIVADERLEGALRSFAVPRHSAVRRGPAALRWLHVLSLGYDTGGHTAFARRWIEAAPRREHHDVALTQQSAEATAAQFKTAVQSRGGQVVAFVGPNASLLETAKWLRSISLNYDAVVLHVHPWDPTPVVAFGAAGGCPVLLLNHADHVFWFGASVADAVLDIRPSGATVTALHRGGPPSLRLPVPLPEMRQRTDARDEAGSRSLRESSGIESNATVYLSIGSRYKYLPVGGISFLQAAGQLLEADRASTLIVIGPDPQKDGWPPLLERFGNRFRMPGVQRDLVPWLAMADVYLEGFPFGSLTALLEAVQAGLLPVLAPAVCPLPYRSDDDAFGDLQIAGSVEDYVALAIDASKRLQAMPSGAATRLSRRVKAMHCLPGWLDALANVSSFVAQAEHKVRSIRGAVPLDAARSRYWADFVDRSPSDNAFGWALRNALRDGLCPPIDGPMRMALRLAHRSGVNVPHPYKALWGGRLLALAPTPSLRRRLYGIQ